MKERDFHKSVADFLAIALPKNAVWSSLAHEGVGARHGAMLKRKGVMVGLPDCFVLHAGLFIGIELKSAVGRPSLEQRQFGLSIKTAGGNWFVVRSINELAANLMACGVPLRAKP